MDTWDRQPTPDFDEDEVKANFKALDAAAQAGEGDESEIIITVNDPYLKDTVVEGYVICGKCQTHNYIRNLGLGDHLPCENCGTDVEITEDNITHAGSSNASKEVRPATGSLKLQTIGKYKIERFIALGGMGEVYLGHHPNLNIPVAIKVLSNDTVRKHPQMRERFLMEAQTAARMNHHNICRVYDADCEGDLFFIVMEFIPGGDVLQAAKKSGGKLPYDKALHVITGVADALREAAKYNIIHRDIKPENIMLSEDGTIKLADLGIAKSVDVERAEGTWSTFTNAVLGTPGYIAPEQSMNARDVDCRTDIYSLGATFYHLVTGQLPFRAASPFQMMYKHVKEPLTDPRELEPDLPENIVNVIKKMMEKDPANRYQTAAELLIDLHRIRDQNAPIAYTATVATEGSPGAAAAPVAKSNTLIIAIAGIAALVILLIGAKMIFAKPPPTPGDPGGGIVVDTHASAAAAAAKQEELRLAEEARLKASAEEKRMAELTTKFRADFDRALVANDFTGATLAVETLEQSFPTEPKIGYDMRVLLNSARQREESRLAAEREASEKAAREAAEAARVAAQQKDETIQRFKGDFEKALAKDDARTAALALDALEKAYPKEPTLYDLRIGLDRLKHKQETQPLLTAAAEAWKNLNNAHLDPGQGFAARLTAIGTDLANGRNLFEAANYADAAPLFTKVVADVKAVQDLEVRRKAVKPVFVDLQEQRKQILADGSQNLPELAVTWTAAEDAQGKATAFFEAGNFDQVDPQARLAKSLYGEMATLAGPLRKRAIAQAALDNALKGANLEQIKALMPQQFEAYEREVRLADASGKDFDGAAAHLTEALKTLNAANAKASEVANQAAKVQTLKAHDEALATAERLYDEANTLRKGGDSNGFRDRASAALTALQPALTPAAQQAVPTSRAPKLGSDITSAIERAFARPETGKDWVIPDLELEMISCQAGNFTMGSTKGKPEEQPVHPVTITRPFWIGKYEVTQRQYVFLTNGNPSREKRMSNPVDSVSWLEAAAFCKRLNQSEQRAGRLPDGYQYRLPTEAEWEYTCRAGSTTEYWFGDDYALLHKYGNYRDASNTAAVSWRDALHNDRSPESRAVGGYEPNKWGLFDTAGNLSEWVADWSGSYPSKGVTDPTGSDRGSKRVLRGGAWTTSYEDCRSAARSEDVPGVNFYGNGFRIVLGPILDTPDNKAGIWGP